MAQLGTIIIVPGIGGCNLSTQRTLFGLGKPLPIWLDPAVMIAGGWRLLGLAANGIDPDVPLTGSIVPGGPLSAYYDLLVQQLGQFGWRVIGARLDWRQDVWRDGQRLAEQIEEQAAHRPIHLIAHSRGGLVARAACSLLASAGKLGLVGRSAGLGVPHYGSWEAAGLLAGWNSTAYLLTALLDRSASILSAGHLNLSIRHVVTSWPAAYQLLPSPAAPGLTNQELTTIYNAAQWQNNGVPVSSSWLAAAHAGWASLPPIPLAVDWIDARGVNMTTPHSMKFPANLASSFGLVWGATGDTTVRADWAVQPGRRVISSNTSHGALVHDRRVIEAVSQALRDGLSADVTIGGPFVY